MKSLTKNIFREIRQTKSRFIAIVAIIALSIGFFSGIKVSGPTLVNTADIYFEDNNLMDFRIVSTVGFDEEDIADIEDIDCVTQVMPSYMADVITAIGETESVVRIHMLPSAGDGETAINTPNLIEGRLPQKSGECIVEKSDLVAGLSLGDTLEIQPTVGDNDTYDYLKKTEYTIVGFVESPMYITIQHGNTDVGNGSISFFAMILPEDFAYEKYTEVFVRTTAADGVSSFSDEYKQRIQDQTASLELLSEPSGERVRADAQQELDEAKEECETQKSEAEQKLADAQQELEESREEFDAKIAEAQSEADENGQLLKDGREQLEAAREEYSAGIAQAQMQLEDADARLEAGRAEYEAALAEYNEKTTSAQAELDALLEQYNAAYDEFVNKTKPEGENAIAQLEAGIAQAQSGIEQYDEALSALNAIPEEMRTDEQKAQIAETAAALQQLQEQQLLLQMQLEEVRAQLEAGEQTLNDTKAQLSAAQVQLDGQAASGQRQLDEAKAVLDASQAELDEGKAELEAQKAAGLQKLNESEAELAEGEARLSEGQAELAEQKAEGEQALNDAEQELAEARQETQEQLAEAQQEIEDAQRELDDLEIKWYVFTRDDNKGYSSLVEDAERVNSIAKVFPVFFMIVAILVCLTTMSRLVEERRTEIGTLKALGYSYGAIVMKYFIYAAAASITGSIIGAVAGLLTLPYIIVDAYGILYTMPKTELLIQWDVVLISSAVAVVLTCFVSVYTCMKELRLKPAVLMRPKSPKIGKRILLEKITLIWKHMSFTSKITARNIFRYKVRFLMTVIGVTGCTALIIAGFGLRASITSIGDMQFSELFQYDVIMSLADEKTSSECAGLTGEITADSSVQSATPVYSGTTSIYKDKSVKQVEFTYMVPDDPAEFERMVNLRDRKTGEKLGLTDDGVIISERLSEILDVSIGDTLTMTIDDDPYQVEITGITENYVSNYIYMTPAYYSGLVGKDAGYNCVFTLFQNEMEPDSNAFAQKWIASDDILTISFVSDTRETIDDMFGSLDIIVIVIILCAGALAIVVLYNLTNINIAEREREIATIKVLGFYDGESAAYIYRENIVLTIVGALCGMLLGSVFLTFIIRTIEMDMVMFSRSISAASYIMGFVLTCVFSGIVNFIMYFKMKKIDMAESLKSVE